MAPGVRARLAFVAAILCGGCAGLLALDEVTFEGRADSGAEVDAATESSSSVPPDDGGAGTDALLTCDADFDNDPVNCGRCNRNCGAGRQCNNRICEPVQLFDPISQIGPVATDATRLYFVGDNEIKSCSKTLVCAPTTFAPSASQPFGIAVASNRVVWTVELAGQLSTCPTGTVCGSVVPLNVAPGSSPYAVALSPDGAQVYWSRLAASDAGPVGLVRCSTSGCAPEFLSAALTPTAIAYSTNLLVWADQGAGQVHACSPDICGQQRVALATQPKSVAVDEQRVYWVESDKIAVAQRSDLSGTATYFRRSSPPWRIAIDDKYVYWTLPGGGQPSKDGAIEYCEKTNCVPKRLAIQQTHPTDLVADGLDVYFTDDIERTIFRVPRP